MNIKNFIITILVFAIGGAVAYRLMQTEPSSAVDSQDDHGEGEDDFERGPNGGRLLESGSLALELTIFESGAPPHYRVYAYDNGEPIPPENVELTIDLHRLGDRVDRIAFTPEDKYLRGLQVVEEPHSFDVSVEARIGEHEMEFHFESHEGRIQLSPEAVKFANLGIDTVGPRLIRDVLSLPGQVAMNEDRIVHVGPRIPGVVRSVHKNLGQTVTEGELLAVIESRELADVKSEYLAVSERRTFALSRFKREENLRKKDVSSEDDYLTAKEALAEAEIRVRSARHKLAALGLDEEALRRIAEEPDMSLTRYEIHAPQSGTLIEKHIARGESVAADADLFMLADLSAVWVKVTVYAQDLRKIRPGQPAIIWSEDLQRKAEGIVAYIGPLIGEDTRNATAIVELPNPEGIWRPGLYVTADIIVEETMVPMAVPVGAVQRFRDWDVVFAQFGDTYEIRMVELGRTDGAWVEVLGGIEPGRAYAAQNSYILKADLEKSGAVHDH